MDLPLLVAWMSLLMVEGPEAKMANGHQTFPFSSRAHGWTIFPSLPCI